MEMQSRIAQGPQFALGLGDEVSPEVVRGAFLQLTKKFHPARFGRMSTEIQRLSNEVFLGIKSAHDVLQRTLGGGLRAARGEGSGAIHVIPAEGSARNTAPSSMRTTASIPRLGSPSTPSQGHTQPLARSPSQRPSSPMNVPRAPTPALGVAVRSSDGTGPLPPRSPGSTGGGRAQTSGTGALPRAQTPGGSRASSSVRPQSPNSSGMLPIQRPGTPPQRPGTPPRRPSTPSQSPPSRDSSARIPTLKTQPLPKAAAAFDERLALREALMSLNEKSWSAAKASLSTLAVKVPHSKQYRSLLCYARGREAHAAGRADEALLEYQRALELDPQLELAKQAMAELTRRR